MAYSYYKVRLKLSVYHKMGTYFLFFVNIFTALEKKSYLCTDKLCLHYQYVQAIEQNSAHEAAGISIEALSIGYAGARNTPHTVAEGLSCEAHKGMLTALLGANGEGKSTLLRTIAGLQPALEGTVRIDGKPIGTLTPRRRATMVATVLTERPHTLYCTAWEMAATGRSPYTGFWGRLSDDDRRAVDEALREAGVSEQLAQKPFARMSDGERQKVLIARALAQQTPVIVLDEPTAFLDYTSKVGIMRLLRRLAHTAGKTILLSTHDVELALQTADTLWMMHRGTIKAGSPDALAADGTLQDFIAPSGATLDTTRLTVTVNRS